jgi:hypothetical protein
MSIELGKGGNGRWRFSEGVNWVSPGLEFNDLGYLRIADRVDHSTSIGYVVTEPKGIFRDYSLQIGQSNGWNFGGEYLGSRVDIRASALFSNKWNFDASIIRAGNSLDTDLLRGGPAMFVRGFLHNSYSIQTDESKRLAFSARYHFHFFDDRISKVNDFSTGIRYKMTETLLLSVNADYSSTRDYFYYLPSVEFGGEKRYPLAQLDRKTLGAILRIDFSISPELTIQYYGNPYVSIGEYSDYKRVSDPRARDYARQLFVYPEGSMVLDSSGENFAIDENRDGEIDYSIEKPDFNFREFRSNLVLRWEYKPGSTFYFVWAHGRSQYTSLSTVSLTDNVEKLFDIYPENVFLVKFNYWLSI